jgi:hypothetical protein
MLESNVVLCVLCGVMQCHAVLCYVRVEDGNVVDSNVVILSRSWCYVVLQGVMRC